MNDLKKEAHINISNLKVNYNCYGSLIESCLILMLHNEKMQLFERRRYGYDRVKLTIGAIIAHTTPKSHFG